MPTSFITHVTVVCTLPSLFLVSRTPVRPALSRHCPSGSQLTHPGFCLSSEWDTLCLVGGRTVSSDFLC